MSPDLQHIAKTGRHQHAGARALSLQYGVRRDGRAVKDGCDVGRRGTGEPQDLLDAVEEAVRRIPWRRGVLAVHSAPDLHRP